MPIYEYHCDSCDRSFETMQRINDPPLEVCEQCGGPVRKLVSAPAFQFKGSGWYVTDYARKNEKGGQRDGASTGDSEKSKKTDSGGGTKSDSGSEAKPKESTSKPTGGEKSSKPASSS